MSRVTPSFATTLPMLSPAPPPPAALLERLRELQLDAQQAEEESSSVRESWLVAVEALLAVLRGWLEAAVRQGLARIDLASVHVADDDVGAYDAPALKITLPGQRIVWVRP